MRASSLLLVLALLTSAGCGDAPSSSPGVSVETTESGGGRVRVGTPDANVDVTGDAAGGRVSLGAGDAKVDVTGTADGGRVSVGAGGVRIDASGTAAGGAVDVSVGGIRIKAGSENGQVKLDLGGLLGGTATTDDEPADEEGDE